MKISKTLIQAIAVAVTLSTVASACTKEKPTDPTEAQKGGGCPGCGMG